MTSSMKQIAVTIPMMLHESFGLMYTVFICEKIVKEEKLSFVAFTRADKTISVDILGAELISFGQRIGSEKIFFRVRI